MTLIQNENKMNKKNMSNVSDSSNMEKTDFNTNKVRTNQGFQKLNQDENFNDVYVGDVEHKIPSKKFKCTS